MLNQSVNIYCDDQNADSIYWKTNNVLKIIFLQTVII